MRGYFVSVFRTITRAVPSPNIVRTYIARHRAAAFVMAAMVLVITTSGLLVAKRFVSAAMQDGGEAGVSSLSVTAGSDETSPHTEPGAHVSQQITNTVSPSGKASTSVSINDQPIAVPKNGSVHKTIRTGDSTMHVDISSSGGATNSSISSFSTNVQSSTNSTFNHYSDQ